MPPIFSLFMRHMLLVIVVPDPFFVGGHQILPRLCRLEIPIGHTPLHIKACFYIVLPSLTQLNFFLANAESIVNLHSIMGEKDAAVVTDECFWATMLTNRRVQHRKVCFRILSARDRRGEDRP